jgi:mRNA interferase RelE/StbE
VKVGFRQSFTRDLAKVKDKGLLRRVKIAIETLERAESLEQIKGVKKLSGVGNYYRLRIGDFRVGLALE